MEKEKFDVTIIIPIYNVQDYILKTLDSLVMQKTNCRIECIIVDDCGSDESIDIAIRFVNRYIGQISFKVFHHEFNRGLSAARNTGILNSEGEYLYFLDGDDTLLPNGLQKLWSIVQRYPHVDVVKGDFVVDGLSDSILNKNYPLYTEDVDWIRTNMCNLSIPESACNCLVRRTLIIENNLLFKEGWIQEDTLWAFKLQRHIKNIAFSFEPTYFYRKNHNSIMNTMSKEKEAMAYCQIFNEAYGDMASGKIEQCEISYLEIIAQRVFNALGEDGMKMLCTSSNIFFIFFFQLKRKLHKDGNRLNKVFLRSILMVFRHLLRFRQVFCYKTKCDN